MIRSIDVVVSIVGLILGLPVLLLLLVIGWFDTGSPVFRQVRVGLKQDHFTLVKFRTMNLKAKSVATHMAEASDITAYGGFLRKTKLDELPQLLNVLYGDMSLVGPRPCLPEQLELIKERERRGLFLVRPGITGLAQVQGVDMSDPYKLSKLDQKMVDNMGYRMYIVCIVSTLLGKGRGDKVRHS